MRGFSLVELLVVLVLIGMVASLAIQGGSQMILMQEKLERAHVRTLNNARANYWFRINVSSAIPVPEASPVLSYETLEFFTAAPLFGQLGDVVPVKWQLLAVGSSLQLVYEQLPHEPIIVREWPGGSGSFDMPPMQDGQWLPNRITLSVDSPLGSEKLVVAITGHKTPLGDFRVLN